MGSRPDTRNSLTFKVKLPASPRPLVPDRTEAPLRMARRSLVRLRFPPRPAIVGSMPLPVEVENPVRNSDEPPTSVTSFAKTVKSPAFPDPRVLARNSAPCVRVMRSLSKRTSPPLPLAPSSPLETIPVAISSVFPLAMGTSTRPPDASMLADRIVILPAFPVP